MFFSVRQKYPNVRQQTRNFYEVLRLMFLASQYDKRNKNWVYRFMGCFHRKDRVALTPFFFCYNFPWFDEFFCSFLRDTLSHLLQKVLSPLCHPQVNISSPRSVFSHRWYRKVINCFPFHHHLSFRFYFYTFETSTFQRQLKLSKKCQGFRMICGGNEDVYGFQERFPIFTLLSVSPPWPIILSLIRKTLIYFS